LRKCGFFESLCAVNDEFVATAASHLLVHKEIAFDNNGVEEEFIAKR